MLIIYGRDCFLKKILIVYTNAGAGHRRAAEALFQVIAEEIPDASVKILDVLSYTKPFFARSYPKAYLFMVNYAPWLWGLFFYFLDIRIIDRFSRVVRRLTNANQCQDFETFILKEQPDTVITTHFLPNEIISHLKKRHCFHTCLATCITDYYPHAFWRNSGVDFYFTPNQLLNNRLEGLGIPVAQIKDLGIPVMPHFGELPLNNEIRNRLGLRNQFTLLITSGGFGVGPIEELVTELEQVKNPIQVMVICGNNQKLREELTNLTGNSKHYFKIFGFVDNMNELMAASDVMISKPGGLTATEAMAMRLPLIILHPIPGQESGNCRFLLEQRAGIKVRSIKEIIPVLEDFLNNPERLLQLKKNISKLGRPQAAREIIAFLNSNSNSEKLSG